MSDRRIPGTLGLGLACLLLVLGSAEAKAGARSSLEALPLAARATIAGALARAEEAFEARATSLGTVELRNEPHDLTATVTGSDVTIAQAGLRWRLALRRWGRGDDLAPVEAGRVDAAGNRIDVRHGALVEWYVNGALGIEQGFTLAASPSGSAGRPVVVEIATRGDAVLEVAEDRRSLVVRGPKGGGHLRYAGLTAYDAGGRLLPVALRAGEGTLTIEVDDREARYPVVIDPLVQTAKFLPTKPKSFLQYGQSVAISGDTLVVGVPSEPIHQGSPPYILGALHVFEKTGPTWIGAVEVAVIRGVVGFQSLGDSVAIDGDTIVAGSTSTTPELVGGQSGGAAAVYVRPPGGWTDMPPTAVLTASDKMEGDTNSSFANAVAIDGDTIVVGAAYFGPSGHGGAYVYEKPPGGWATGTETGKLTAEVPIFGERLGMSVAVSGDVIVVGAPDSSTGSALVYERPFGGWAAMTETAAIGPSDGETGDAFGLAVAIDGATIAVGAVGRDLGGYENAGQVYVFEQPIGGWLSETETAILQPSIIAGGGFFGGAQIGVSLAIAGSRIVVGAQSLVREPFDDLGGVYVFEEPVGGWAPVAETALLTPSDGGRSFGAAVDVGDDGVIAVSTPNTDPAPYVVVGAAYAFEELADAVTCPSAPAVGCVTGAKGQLKLKYNTAKRPGTQLQWKLGAGPELHRPDFGDPLTATSYALCVYDDGLLTIASPLLGGFGRWALAGTDAFAYANKDKTYAIGGFRKAQLKGGVAGKSAIQVQGKGTDVGNMPQGAAPDALLHAASAVLVQLHQAGGICYETTFLPADVKTNSWGFVSPTSSDLRGAFQAGY